MRHTLASLFAPYDRECTLYGAVDREITDVLYDSRRINLAKRRSRETANDGGVLFFALPGIHSDGLLFIDEALKNGAVAFVCEGAYENVQHYLTARQSRVGCVLVKEGSIRKIMAEVSARFFDYPARELRLCGVTGTDGKSTSVEFIHQLLTSCDIRAGLWSTVHCFDGTEYSGNDFRQSTPEAPDMHRAMRRMRDKDCTHAVLEVTSHALSDKTMRVHGIEFDVAALTNVESEHLDFHGTVQQYVRDKSTLFMRIKPKGFGLIQCHERYAELCASQTRQASAKLASYCVCSTEQEMQYCDVPHAVIDDDILHARYALKNVKVTLNATYAVLFCDGVFVSELCVPCVGLYNAENALLALSVVHLFGIASLNEIALHTSKLRPPRGRMHTIYHKGITGIVDYAHTPGSFQKLLPMMRSVVKGQLIVVFGSAGERDVQKRAEQGSIADSYADIIVLADEDPRAEDPLSILHDIVAGMQRSVGASLMLIPDRKHAIHRACAMARQGDCVLCLGKGHEKNIEYVDHVIDWDEIAVLDHALKMEW